MGKSQRAFSAKASHMNLIYTETAILDLERLRAFIAEKDPAAAERVGAELVARVESLLIFPRMGTRVETAPDPEVVRDFTFGKYVVRYAVREGVVGVLRVWHHFEDKS